MRVRGVRSVGILVLLTTGSVALLGCNEKAEVSAATESSPAIEAALTEDHEAGSIDWDVAPDGTVKAAVKALDGKPLSKDSSGTLTWRGPNGETTLPLVLDSKTGLLTASGPKLEADLTEVKYTVTVAGKPWNGTLQVPVGGTKALVDGATKASAKVVPVGKTGPNGGVIQVVGEDTVEVVADKTSGQVRLYVLDADLKPIPVGGRKIKLGLVGESSEVVVLAPDPGGLYCFGTLAVRANPVKITISIAHADHRDVVLVGYRPGSHIVVSAAAPVVNILVATSWNVSVKVKTPGIVVVHDDDDDDGDIHIHLHGHGRGHGHKHGKKHWH